MTGLRNINVMKVKRISVPKSYDVLANQLREAILKGEVREGDMLPPERELVSQSGLSRGAVREALRMLGAEGLLLTKHGRFGGNVVTLPGNVSMANAIDQFVRGRRISLRALQETREVLEPGIARLAAQRRTPQHIAELKSLQNELIEAVDKFQSFSLINIKWHSAVAKAADSELLYAFLYSILYGVAVSTTSEEFDTNTRAEVIRVHGRINDAIEAGDAEAAEQRMRKHVLATRARIGMPETTPIPLSEDATPDER